MTTSLQRFGEELEVEGPVLLAFIWEAITHIGFPLGKQIEQGLFKTLALIGDNVGGEVLRLSARKFNRVLDLDLTRLILHSSGIGEIISSHLDPSGVRPESGVLVGQKDIGHLQQERAMKTNNNQTT